MAERPDINPFLAKAEQSLAGAESELANGRYDNCADRCYYACFQAAAAALLLAGIQSSRQSDQWSHDAVQAQFVGQLINRRKLYPSALRDTLIRGFRLRATADHQTDPVTDVQASRGLGRASEFVEAIRRGGTRP